MSLRATDSLMQTSEQIDFLTNLHRHETSVRTISETMQTQHKYRMGKIVVCKVIFPDNSSMCIKREQRYPQLSKLHNL